MGSKIFDGIRSHKCEHAHLTIANPQPFQRELLVLHSAQHSKHSSLCLSSRTAPGGHRDRNARRAPPPLFIKKKPGTPFGCPVFDCSDKYCDFMGSVGWTEALVYRFAHWGGTFSPKTPYFRATTLKHLCFVESTFEMDKAIVLPKIAMVIMSARKAPSSFLVVLAAEEKLAFQLLLDINIQHPLPTLRDRARATHGSSRASPDPPPPA